MAKVEEPHTLLEASSPLYYYCGCEKDRSMKPSCSTPIYRVLQT